MQQLKLPIKILVPWSRRSRFFRAARSFLLRAAGGRARGFLKLLSVPFRAPSLLDRDARPRPLPCLSPRGRSLDQRPVDVGPLLRLRTPRIVDEHANQPIGPIQSNRCYAVVESSDSDEPKPAGEGSARSRPARARARSSPVDPALERKARTTKRGADAARRCRAVVGAPTDGPRPPMTSRGPDVCSRTPVGRPRGRNVRGRSVRRRIRLPWPVDLGCFFALSDRLRAL